jgi:hypothetical protein
LWERKLTTSRTFGKVDIELISCKMAVLVPHIWLEDVNALSLKDCHSAGGDGGLTPSTPPHSATLQLHHDEQQEQAMHP